MNQNTGGRLRGGIEKYQRTFYTAENFRAYHIYNNYADSAAARMETAVLLWGIFFGIADTAKAEDATRDKKLETRSLPQSGPAPN